MKMQVVFLFVLVLFSASMACESIVPSKPKTLLNCTETVDAMRVLTTGLGIPESVLADEPVKPEDAFDVNAYFSVLDHLSVRPGYKLDYVYHYDGMGGCPILYARPEGQPPIKSSEIDPRDYQSYLDYIQVDGTPESYFQFAAMDIMGNPGLPG